ncbi:MAG: DnaD domain protein [Dehalococcoidia bacterium]
MSNGERFEGFPAKTDYTPIPNLFFSSIVPVVEDLAELKVTLYIFWSVYRKKGYPRFTTYGEMRGDQALMAGLCLEGDPAETLNRGLASAVSRGTLLKVNLENEDSQESLYFLNTQQNREAIIQIERGDIQLDGIVRVEPAAVTQRPNIFTLYEQHIGLLTPMVAEDLKEAEQIYPESWIEDAFRESVRLNKRSWRYISKILERWASQGKDYGRTGEDSKKDISPKEYIRKYGNPTRRDRA